MGRGQCDPKNAWPNLAKLKNKEDKMNTNPLAVEQEGPRQIYSCYDCNYHTVPSNKNH